MHRAPPRGLFGWHCKSADPTIASVRLRCLKPLEELTRAGVAVELYTPRHRTDYCGVVFCKSYDDEALALAAALRESGRRVIFDICDNHFAGEESGDPKLRQRADRLESMLALASDIVVSTPTLADQVAARVAHTRERMRIIPDPLDIGGAGQGLSLIDRYEDWRLRRFLKRYPDALHLVWFGNSGAQHMASGVADLERMRPMLEARQQTRPVTLTVIGNSRRRSRKATGDWPTPVHTMPWSLSGTSAALARHDVAIVPISMNAFTLGKSINRPASAILAGLGVIADALPSYEELRPYIYLDDWEAGLDHYADSRAQETPRLKAADIHLRETYGAARIGRLWQDLLEAA